MRRFVAIVGLGFASLVLLAGPAMAQAPGSVVVTRVEGPVTPVLADHITDAIQDAARADAELLVIELDTPGGLDSAMRQIVQDLLAAPIPVAVFVAPPGGRAASAGAIITLASHVAAMSPGTNIGAATPIDLQGGEVLDKVVNDAAAYVEAIAEFRGRDAGFYVDAVREGRSVAAEVAVELGAVDLVADDLGHLLTALDGRQVDVRGRGSVTLDTAGAPVERFELSWVRSLLQRLADPNLAYILLSMGTLSIVYEVAHPGGGFGGAAGAVMLVLGLFSLSVLPVNIAAVLLVVLAGALFVAEAIGPGFGAFAGGGTLALAVAGLLLFQRPTGIGVSPWLVAGVALVTGAAAAGVAWLALETRRRPPTIGAAGSMVGAVGVVKEVDEEGLAQVLLEGARWQAVTAGPPLEPGMRVKVIGIEGLLVSVVPAEARVPVSA